MASEALRGLLRDPEEVTQETWRRPQLVLRHLLHRAMVPMTDGVTIIDRQRTFHQIITSCHHRESTVEKLSEFLLITTINQLLKNLIRPHRQCCSLLTSSR